jgi:hypothetical protein
VAHLCMVLMAALPLAVGGSALIGVLRLRGGQRVGR